MAKLKREKIMIYARPFPLKGINLMADSAIFRKTCQDVVRIGGAHEVITVAVDAVNSQNIEPDRIF
jgi:hypothetical protein